MDDTTLIVTDIWGQALDSGDIVIPISTFGAAGAMSDIIEIRDKCDTQGHPYILFLAPNVFCVSVFAIIPSARMHYLSVHHVQGYDVPYDTFREGVCPPSSQHLLTPERLLQTVTVSFQLVSDVMGRPRVVMPITYKARDNINTTLFHAHRCKSSRQSITIDCIKVSDDQSHELTLSYEAVIDMIRRLQLLYS